ncbi:hypothetical protein C1H46_020811 [Malus baccata]|uniref:Uncharacterized protein n=1 Tax=Malus baccata TaxID=106549 RepID=A0A540M4C6_MALBA|nr:hypothetical protein C1H46_020811 [Malus baccata]
MVHSDEVLQLYTDLIKLDPSHSQYYKDEHSLVFLRKVITSSPPLVVGYDPLFFQGDAVACASGFIFFCDCISG